MKTTFFIALGVIAILLMSLQFKESNTNRGEENKGIVFHQGTWKEIFQIAKKENKIIFLDVYASWCGPCKMLKRNTFSNEEVGTFYNEKFINYAIDGELGEGPELAKKYKVSGYPTLLFIRPDGSVLTSTAGYHNVEQFLELGNSVSSK